MRQWGWTLASKPRGQKNSYRGTSRRLAGAGNLLIMQFMNFYLMRLAIVAAAFLSPICRIHQYSKNEQSCRCFDRPSSCGQTIRSKVGRQRPAARHGLPRHLLHGRKFEFLARERDQRKWGWTRYVICDRPVVVVDCLSQYACILRCFGAVIHLYFSACFVPLFWNLNPSPTNHIPYNLQFVHKQTRPPKASVVSRYRN